MKELRRLSRNMGFLAEVCEGLPEAKDDHSSAMRHFHGTLDERLGYKLSYTGDYDLISTGTPDMRLVLRIEHNDGKGHLELRLSFDHVDGDWEWGYEVVTEGELGTPLARFERRLRAAVEPTAAYLVRNNVVVFWDELIQTEESGDANA